jgi:glycosyltransferase involved in cell wall biosynthesis
MTIAGIFNQNLLAGGSYHQGLNALLQIRALCNGKHELIVFTTVQANEPILVREGFRVRVFRTTLRDLAVCSLGSFPLLLARLRWPSSFEKKLIGENVDLVYFVYPSLRVTLLQRLNYIFTVMDLCHRDFPEFPEVREAGVFECREQLYRAALPKAVLILADSIELKERIVRRYGIDGERVLAMPFQPSALLKSGDNLAAVAEAETIYQLPEGYLFYPAQFWSHKGHIRLLEALVLLRRKEGDCPRCVFTGSDHGNLRFVEQKVEEFGLQDRVHFLGLVPSHHLAPLYRRARALVMPTYFGSTNLPPLEAWSLDVPLLYPEHLRGQAGDAALYFNVDSAESLAAAIEKSADPICRERIISAGRARLKELAAERTSAELVLIRQLDLFCGRHMMSNSAVVTEQL